MKKILSERNLVVIVFFAVLVIFSLAQKDTEKIERIYKQFDSPAAADAMGDKPAAEAAAELRIPEAQTFPAVR